MSEVELLLRFALGAVFLPAGLSKLPNLESFENAVRDYRLIPPRVTSEVAIAVALAEAAVGVLLLTGVLLLRVPARLRMSQLPVPTLLIVAADWQASCKSYLG
jgi:uncharacterized membrane protein YphA (DoxX/SURF4 family)